MRSKRFMALLLSAIMLLSIMTAGMTVQAELSFNDTDGHWGEAAIEYVVDAGLMNGVGDGSSFAPDMSLTRGMVVTVLYRDNGSPKAEFNGTFLDVAEGAYYTAAAEWAFANNIVNGTGTDEWGVPYFSPDRDITRQELATMFKRYADFKYVDTSIGAADIASFPDASGVADWATDAVKWAVGVGLITGKGNGGAATLSPTDKAVRAEFATIIKRFKEADFEYHLVYNAPVPLSTFTEITYDKVENADIYVAVDGSDKNPGTLDKPLATFAAAKAKVRELKKTAKDEIIVAFKAGDYGVLDNIEFTAEDGGTEKVPVTYCAYGDGDVYFTNGIFIDEDDFTSLDEADKKFFTEEFTGDIKKVDLSSHPNADLINYKTPLSNSSGFCWQARTPNKKNGTDAYYGGFTKYIVTPDSPYTIEEIIADVIQNGYLNEHTIVRPYVEQKKLQAVRVMKDKLDSYDNHEGIQLIGHLSKVWHSDALDLKSYDKTTGIMEFYNAADHGFVNVDETQEAYISNASKELDDIGEYWVDANTKTLYVYKPDGAYTISSFDTFITINELVNYINFTRLNFRACSGVAINAHGDNFTMDQCSITYVGGTYALYSYNALNVKIINSTFAYCSETAVYVRGPVPGKRAGYDYYALNNTGFVFRNNLIHDVCMASVPVEAGGLLYGYQIGADVSHNEIYNSARYGIDFKYGNIDCIMEYNYLHHCMQNSADGGAFYCGRVSINRGNVIRYNIVADIVALNPIHTGGTYAIYMDDSHENLICYANVFYNSGQIMNNGGRDHEFYDNVFIKGTSGIIGKDAHLRDISKYADADSIFSEGWNSVDLVPDENTANGQLWKSKWPELYDVVAIRKNPSIDLTTLALYSKPMNYCHNNYTIAGAEHTFSPEWVKYSDHENNADIPDGENPFFVDPTHGNYTVVDGAELMDNHFALIGRY